MRLSVFIAGACALVTVLLSAGLYFQAEWTVGRRFADLEQIHASSVREFAETALKAKRSAWIAAVERSNKAGLLARYYLLRNDHAHAKKLADVLKKLKDETGCGFVGVLDSHGKDAGEWSVNHPASFSKVLRGKTLFTVVDGSNERFVVLYFPLQLFNDAVGVGYFAFSLSRSFQMEVAQGVGGTIAFSPPSGRATKTSLEGPFESPLAIWVESPLSVQNREARLIWLYVTLAGLASLMVLLYIGIQKGFGRAFAENLDNLQALTDALEEGNALLLSSRLYSIKELTELSAALKRVSYGIRRYQERIALKTRTEAIGEKTAQVAHDLRGPLAALEAALDLEKNKTLTEPKKQMLNRLLGRLKEIAKDVSPRGAAASTEQAIATSVNELVSSLVKEKQEQYRSRAGIALHWQPGPEVNLPLTVSSFKRAISNLIDNAVEAIAEHGEVEIQFISDRDGAHITVRDNGRGIAADDLKQLGTRGFSSGKQHGSGLGVWFAQETVQKLGGALSFQSTNGATEARITFPVTASLELVVAPSCTVVVLDDEAWVHDVWKARFAHLVDIGAITLVHCSGSQEFIETAIRLRHQRSEALFLCDQELKGEKVDGLDLIDELRIAEHSVLVTGNASRTDVQKRVLEIGCRLFSKAALAAVEIRLKHEALRRQKS